MGRIERECAAGKQHSVWLEHFRPEDCKPQGGIHKLRLRDHGGYKAEAWLCEPNFSPPARPEDFGKRPREEKEWVVPDRPQSQIEEGTRRQPPTNRQQQAPRRALDSVVNRLAAADGGSPLAEDLKGQVQAAVEARVQAEQADNTVEVDGEQLNITELLAKYKRVKEERQQSTARGLIRAESWAADAHLGGRAASVRAQTGLRNLEVFGYVLGMTRLYFPYGTRIYRGRASVDPKRLAAAVAATASKAPKPPAAGLEHLKKEAGEKKAAQPDSSGSAAGGTKRRGPRREDSARSQQRRRTEGSDRPNRDGVDKTQSRRERHGWAGSGRILGWGCHHRQRGCEDRHAAATAATPPRAALACCANGSRLP
eukprot:COSAG04_NODE_1812_length_5513_cov_55.382342_4_plen_368_part_00